jgi:hypothetical protein
MSLATISDSPGPEVTVPVPVPTTEKVDVPESNVKFGEDVTPEPVPYKISFAGADTALPELPKGVTVPVESFKYNAVPSAKIVFLSTAGIGTSVASVFFSVIGILNLY